MDDRVLNQHLDAVKQRLQGHTIVELRRMAREKHREMGGDIDPEDREAYYHLALNYRAIGNLRKATIMEQAFKYYSIDESASEAAQKYRKKNPGDNIMAQDIKIHKLKF